MFPIESPDLISAAARNALRAAVQAVEAVKRLGGDDDAALDIIVALHVGTAIYGNVGAADRLDFTVIGPAVNLVSRIEAVGKTLDVPIIVTDDFANAYGEPLQPLGRHILRGLATPHELFTPISLSSVLSSPANV
jgi:adenylate cyclase